MAYERVGPEGEAALTADLKAFLESTTRPATGRWCSSREYLEVDRDPGLEVASNSARRRLRQRA